MSRQRVVLNEFPDFRPKQSASLVEHDRLLDAPLQQRRDKLISSSSQDVPPARDVDVDGPSGDEGAALDTEDASACESACPSVVEVEHQTPQSDYPRWGEVCKAEDTVFEKLGDHQ